MFKKILQVALIAIVAGMQTGCLYMAFEKHGGSFLVQPSGDQFVHIPNESWDSSSQAIVYFYRPDSRWGQEEIDAPSTFIDDRRYVSLRASGYSWLVMEPGTRRITMRRPIGLLLGFEGTSHFTISKIVDADFEVEAGKVYYFRYSEVEGPSEPNPDLDADDPLAQGDMQLVSRDVAIKEIVKTRFMLNRPPFAKNKAGASIVENNKEDDYKKQIALLEEEKEEELARLKEEGHWRSPKWYWPFGGKPTKRVDSELEIKKLTKQRNQYLVAKAEADAAAAGPKWWKFGADVEEEGEEEEK